MQTLSGKTLEAYFERTYYSHLMHKRKPDPAIYEQVLQENKLIPDQTIFFDDSPTNISGAESIGIRGQLIVPGTTVKSLAWLIN